MPIVAVKPGVASQFFQVAQPQATRFRVLFSCSDQALFMAMPVAELQKFLMMAPAIAFVQATLGPVENHPIDFVVQPATPWAIVVGNKGADTLAAYWQTFIVTQ